VPKAFSNLVAKINQEVLTPGGNGWREVLAHNDFLRYGPGVVAKQFVPDRWWNQLAHTPPGDKALLPWRWATGKGPFPFSAHFDIWDMWKLTPLLAGPIESAKNVFGEERR
jgi:hypothetical protein